MEVWAPVSAGSGYSDEEALFYSDNMFENREYTVGFVQVVLDKKILNDALRKILFNSSLIAMIFLAISIVIVFFVVKGITKPLNRLTERVKVMGSGTPLEKVPVETQDEIGKLATAFNLMAESLQSLLQFNRPLHAAQNTEPLIMIRLPENFSQSRMVPLKLYR